MMSASNSWSAPVVSTRAEAESAYLLPPPSDSICTHVRYTSGGYVFVPVRSAQSYLSMMSVPFGATVSGSTGCAYTDAVGNPTGHPSDEAPAGSSAWWKVQFAV